MQHTKVRWAMLLLVVCAVLFTADAAIAASVSPSVLIEIVLGAVGLAAVMMDLAERALHGTPRERHVAILALNGIGVAPAAATLAFLRADISDDALLVATRATVVWFLAVLAWTTGVVWLTRRDLHVARRHVLSRVRPQYQQRKRRSAQHFIRHAAHK